MKELEQNLMTPVATTAKNRKQTKRRQKNAYIRAKTAAILRELGIPAHLAGYLYLVEAVQLALTLPERPALLTVDLYRGVALHYHTTAAAVERAIRHAIETGCCRCDLDTFAYYFGNTVSPQRGKPSNSELIARVVNLVKQEDGQ